MDVKRLYDRLILCATDGDLSAEDRHVLASILSIAAIEADSASTICDGSGLDRDTMMRMLQRAFPGAVQLLFSFKMELTAEASAEETAIRTLLLRMRSLDSPLAPLLSRMIARRAMRPNHLWQDLGLRNRNELSGLMQRHFAPLARKNHQDMKWKKFFYRLTCSEEGFSLCAAPVCSACRDFESCFGDESGESLLARNQFVHLTAVNFDRATL